MEFYQQHAFIRLALLQINEEDDPTDDEEKEGRLSPIRQLVGTTTPPRSILKRGGSRSAGSPIPRTVAFSSHSKKLKLEVGGEENEEEGVQFVSNLVTVPTKTWSVEGRQRRNAQHRQAASNEGDEEEDERDEQESGEEMDADAEVS